jgi:hypothetical protein
MDGQTTDPAHERLVVRADLAGGGVLPHEDE